MRFSADNRRAAEITRIGRSTRPATSQLSTAASPVTTTSARAAWGSSADRVSACTRSARASSPSCGDVPGEGVPSGSRWVKITRRRISR
ncbi:hypothetical protein [Nonomuraea sp. NEAU-A123]|uniref:hypothetical protein n=1 Tax=Nonomuraea sp. NEAU-A123 TaxID=2839649 RepID=UPI001BE41FA6|nr:hypothetical protein [Nonomuraea sp. NEAU-A123]